MEIDHKKIDASMIDSSSSKEQAILEAANKLKSVFLDNMSHELRTPITVILGYAGILYDELQDPDLKEMAEIILKSSNRLTDSLNLLLDQSEIDSERLKVEFQKIDLVEKLNNTFHIFKPVADDKGLKFNFNCTLPEAYCEIDEKMFNKVMNNLINNAVKFTEQGEVSITLNRENKNGTDYYVVKVSDTGIGIPEEKQSLIFEAFRQVSEGMNRLHQGTGLGLSITKTFVELMKGEITVRSKIREGSSFSIAFPAVD